MKIYNYDAVTKEFKSESKAIVNPLEKDKYLIPAYATIKEPLIKKTDFAVCFIDGAWAYIVDNRAKTYYLNSKKVEFNIGDEITPDMTLAQFTDNELLQQSKDKKIAFIDSTTSSDIKALVGDNNKQKDLLATYNYLQDLKIDGLLIDGSDEAILRDDLKNRWANVKILKTSGNDREALVSEITLDALDADGVTLLYPTLADAISAVEAI